MHGHESKCRHLHGHDYQVEVTAIISSAKHGGRSLDDIGRVIDFSVLKDVIGTWIDAHWDHKFLLWTEDPMMGLVVSKQELSDHDYEQVNDQLGDSICGVPFNPTAENIATFLGEDLCPTILYGSGVEVINVVVHETPNCFASWSAK